MKTVSLTLKRVRRIGAAAVAMCTALAMVAACSPAEEQSEQVRDTLVIRQEIPPVLDPAFMESDRQRTLIDNLFEPLVRMSSNAEVVPALAESWEISDDGTTLTFAIRADAKFSDGSNLTAHDIRYSLVRALTPVSAEEQQALGVDSASPKGLAVLPDVLGVAEISAGSAEELPEDAITALDDTTLVIKLAGPSADILARLAYPALGVVQQENVETSESGQPWWYRPVASGPFQLDEFESESLAMLSPNNDYYGSVSSLSSVSFRVVEDTQTAIVGWESGDMDIVKVLNSDVQNLRESGHEDDLASVQDAQTVVLLANPVGPTADLHVLRALAMALDKDKLAGALDDLVTPAHTFTSPVAPGYNLDGVPTLDFDVEAAKAELARSDFAAEDISIRVNNPGNLDARALPVITQMWEQNLGITVRILNELPPATAPEGQAANLLLIAQGPNYTGTCAMARRWPDFLTFAQGANNVNFGAITAPGLQEVVQECTTAEDDAAAWQTVAEFETLLMKHPQFIPVWYDNSTYLVDPAVENVRFGNNWQIANLPEVTVADE